MESALPGRPGGAGRGGEWRQLTGLLLATGTGGRLRQGHLWELVRRLARIADIHRRQRQPASLLRQYGPQVAGTASGNLAPHGSEPN
jgi:hypothetical protein